MPFRLFFPKHLPLSEARKQAELGLHQTRWDGISGISEQSPCIPISAPVSVNIRHPVGPRPRVSFSWGGREGIATRFCDGTHWQVKFTDEKT